MVDLNVKFRKRMRVAAMLTLALGVALDVGMFLLTHWIFPPISIFSIFCAYIGLVFVTIGDVAGVRYMELRPDGVMQKYLVWQRLIPWEDFQQIGARELGSRMGKEYCHSLVFYSRRMHQWVFRNCLFHPVHFLPCLYAQTQNRPGNT